MCGFTGENGQMAELMLVIAERKKKKQSTLDLKMQQIVFLYNFSGTVYLKSQLQEKWSRIAIKNSLEDKYYTASLYVLVTAFT